MTTPTHIISSISILLLTAVTLRCLDTSWPYILFTILAGLLPDIDTPRSIPGYLMQRLVRLVSFGRVDLSRLEHRGFTHSIPFLIFLCLILWPIKAELIPYLVLGFLGHIYLDSFQKTGIKLLGWGNSWFRFSLKYTIPLRSPGEYGFMAAGLFIIILCSVILHRGGASAIIRQALGTVRASSEALSEWQDYRLSLVVTKGTQSEEYEVIDAFGDDAIILRRNGVPLKYGYSDTSQLRAQGTKSYAVRHEKVSRITYPFVMRDEPLRALYERIEQAYPYHLSGSALMKESLTIPKFYNRYNTVEAEGKRLSLHYARLDDLDIYGIANNKVDVGDFTVTYQVREGQDVSALKDKVSGEVSSDITTVMQRIAELESMAEADVSELLGISRENAAVYEPVFRRMVKELLEAEKRNLLRLRSIRREQ